MRVLILSPHAEKLINLIKRTGDEAIATNERISAQEVTAFGANLIISYSYHYFIPDDIIKVANGNIIDLHISFLPWNRGADPHFWSFFDGTPKGVSIYRMLNSRQEGELLAQREVTFTAGETLTSTYEMLHREVEALFMEVWPDLRAGRLPPIAQATPGTFHHIRDKDLFFVLLRKGWDSPVGAVEELGRRFRGLSTAPSASKPDDGLHG